MHAIAIERFGGPEVLQPMDLPDPKLGPDTILVRIHAAGVNPVDFKLRQGNLDAAFEHRFPVIPGWDAAGVVEKVGPAVRGYEPGEEVFAYARRDAIGEGTYAELVPVTARHLARRPRSLPVEHAAGVPLAGLTAYQMLHEGIEVQSGQTILVHAAAGGVGGFAVQLARLAGARVIGTASAANHEYLRELGATHCIDYTATDVPAAVRELAPEGVDGVLDTVGGETRKASYGVLREGGRLVSIIAPPPEAPHRYVFVHPDAEQLARLSSLLEAGELRVHVEEAFPLDRAREAQERQEAGHVRGKLVLTV